MLMTSRVCSCIGAIKDSIVGKERLVRHLLLELAHQPSFTGHTKGGIFNQSWFLNRTVFLACGDVISFCGQEQVHRQQITGVMPAHEYHVWRVAQSYDILTS